MVDVFKVYPKELAIAVCARLGTDVAFYTFALFILTYVTTELGLAKTTALNAVLIASAFQLFLIQPSVPHPTASAAAPSTWSGPSEPRPGCSRSSRCSTRSRVR